MCTGLMCRNGVLEFAGGPAGFFWTFMVSPLSDRVDEECLLRVLDDALEEGCDDCRDGGPDS